MGRYDSEAGSGAERIDEEGQETERSGRFNDRTRIESLVIETT